jgi:hypothetical protein
MSVEGYANFLRIMGHRVHMTDTCCWFNVSSGFYMNFPFHRPVSPVPAEIRDVLGLWGIGVRYTCPVEEGRPSYKIVCTDKDYGYLSLPQKGRNRTRRGMENCSVRRLDFDELEPVGALDLNRDTLVRQGRRIPTGHDDYWHSYYAAASSSDCMEAWGSFVGNELAAYLIACKIEDCMNIFILRSHSKHLKENPNNALFFVFTGDVLSRKEINEVSTGLESPQSDVADLERFKQRMGFQKVPIGQRIEFRPLLKPFLRLKPLRKFQDIVSKMEGGEKFSKLSGILRWYSEQPAF